MAKGEVVKYIPILDTSLNDSDKTVDLGTGINFDCQLLWLHVDYTSTATVGNRLLKLEILDPDGNSCGHVHPGSFQAASNVYHYYFLPGIYRETISAVAETGVDGTIQVPIPEKTIIPKGYSLAISDVEAVDAAADDMSLHGMLQALR